MEKRWVIREGSRIMEKHEEGERQITERGHRSWRKDE
jgi:hypothetical protein